jgi:hypothetical protein
MDRQLLFICLNFNSDAAKRRSQCRNPKQAFATAFVKYLSCSIRDSKIRVPYFMYATGMNEKSNLHHLYRVSFSFPLFFLFDPTERASIARAGANDRVG